MRYSRACHFPQAHAARRRSTRSASSIGRSTRSWGGSADTGPCSPSAFIVFGTGVYVADPDEIRSFFTGDQSDLLAGEANSVLSPVLGDNSVLVLDGPRHLRQRKLLLPPFQGSAVASFREIILRSRRPRSSDGAAATSSRCASGCGRSPSTSSAAPSSASPSRRGSIACAPRSSRARLTGRHPPPRRASARPRAAESVGADASAGSQPPTGCSTRRSSAGGASPISSSAPTCSRCCCAPATRTGSR